MDPLMCGWDTAKLLIFSDNVFDPLIYYSHLTALILSLGFGLFVFFSNRKSLVTRVLFAITLCLSAWLWSDLVLWATEKSELTMSFWSFTILFEPIVYALGLYFIYLFIDGKDVSFGKKVLMFGPLLVTVLLAPTSFAMLGFDLSTCDRDAIEGPLVYYGYALEILYVLWIVMLAFERYKQAAEHSKRRQIAFATTGTVLFLLSFAFGNIVGSLFADANFLGEDYSWTIGQYGLFGVPVFIGLLSYLIVRYKAFNVKLFGAQALVFAIVFLVGSEFLFVTTTVNRVLVAVTFVLVCVGGTLLIRSVRGEIKAKENLQAANTRLKELDVQKTEFVSFATHQLRSPLTSMRGNVSLILEGDYGPVDGGVRDVINVMAASIKTMVNVVEDYLNVSRIELGTMKYALQPMDFKRLVDEVLAEQKVSLEARGLAFSLSTDGAAAYPISADPDKFKQVVMNVVDNSIKYTPQGSISLSLSKDAARGAIRLSVVDTGVGIRPDVIPKLFQKFSRAPKASEANIHGTGLGLFIAKEIMAAHKGRIWAESEGEGKGSQFYIELPEAR